MEDITYEYDWRHPITVPNPKNKSGVSVENGSFKWFEYWLKHGCTYKQIAEYFNTSESGVQTIASLFKWKERKKNREDYLSRQREKALINNYNSFIEKDFKNAETVLTGIYTLIQMAFVTLNIMPDPGLNIPDDIDTKEALDIVKTYPKTARNVYNQILRDLQQPEHINRTENEIQEKVPELADAFKTETLDILEHSKYAD